MMFRFLTKLVGLGRQSVIDMRSVKEKEQQLESQKEIYMY